MTNDFEEKIVTIYIPDCCKEGRPDCPHGVPKPKPEKRNTAL